MTLQIRQYQPPGSSSSPRVPSTPLGKRPRPNDENVPPQLPWPAATPNPGPPCTPLAPKPRSKRQKTEPSRRYMYSKDKLEYILDVLEEINWSIPELMKYTFMEPEKVKRSLRHAGVASKFLTRKDKVTPGQILQLWDKSADGRIEREENMFSTTVQLSPTVPRSDNRWWELHGWSFSTSRSPLAKFDFHTAGVARSDFEIPGAWPGAR